MDPAAAGITISMPTGTASSPPPPSAPLVGRRGAGTGTGLGADGRHDPDDADAAALAVLVVEARSGSEDAWAALYERVRPKLLAYARRRLPTDEHASDAVSEALTRAVAGIGRWHGDGGGFLAWLYGILRHVVVDAQRDQWREATAARGGLARGLGPPGHGPPDELCLLREDAHRVRAAFGKLSAPEREILTLRVVDGLPAEQVGAALGQRPGAVRMAQSRALARLRRHLADEERCPTG